MIDIHAHILPNIDDGAQTFNEALEMISEAKKNGFTSIICTSHYGKNAYESGIDTRKELIEKLSNISNNGVELYIGSEIYISPDLDELIKNKIVATLNNTKYVLFELPIHAKVLYTEFVVEKLLNEGITPILAHPERYSYMQFRDYEKLLKKGVLFQCNFRKHYWTVWK